MGGGAVMAKLIRPLMYHCKHGVNDAHWIISRMKVIPESLRQEVTNEYERLVKPNSGYSGRDEANKYLKEVSDKYRPEVKEREIKLKAPVKRVKSGERKYLSDDKLWSKKV